MNTQFVAPRVSVLLEDAERAALRDICNADRRPPQWTLRWLIVEEAKRRGLIPASTDADGAEQVTLEERVQRLEERVQVLEQEKHGQE